MHLRTGPPIANLSTPSKANSFCSFSATSDIGDTPADGAIGA